jgi:hypothetical protein
MAWLFSKRCNKALSEKKLIVSIPLRVRIRIWKLLERENEYFDEVSDTFFRSSTSVLQTLPDKMKSEIGQNLMAYPEEGGDARPSSLEEFVLHGNYPPYLFDCMELFYINLSQEKKYKFQSEFNQIMEESLLPWRMAEGKVFPINSAYIEDEIINNSLYLLNQAGFEGALKEFVDARTDLSRGENLSAITKANLAIESIIKSILDVEKAKPGELFRKMIDSGIIPQYYDDFLSSFEEILRSVTIMRNEEPGAGHGSGPKVNEIPDSLAELCINLCAVLINFLVNRHLELKPDSATPFDDNNEYDDIPF